MECGNDPEITAFAGIDRDDVAARHRSRLVEAARGDAVDRVAAGDARQRQRKGKRVGGGPAHDQHWQRPGHQSRIDRADGVDHGVDMRQPYDMAAAGVGGRVTGFRVEDFFEEKKIACC